MAGKKETTVKIEDIEKESMNLSLDAEKENFNLSDEDQEGNIPKEPETVKIRLFKDSDKYSDDVFVGINGKSYLLQRGIDIEVPKAVAEVLNNSQIQDSRANDFMEKLEKEFNGRKREME